VVELAGAIVVELAGAIVVELAGAIVVELAGAIVVELAGAIVVVVDDPHADSNKPAIRATARTTNPTIRILLLFINPLLVLNAR